VHQECHWLIAVCEVRLGEVAQVYLWVGGWVDGWVGGWVVMKLLGFLCGCTCVCIQVVRHWVLTAHPAHGN
jgi:hypothetical protein